MQQDKSLLKRLQRERNQMRRDTLRRAAVREQEVEIAFLEAPIWLTAVGGEVGGCMLLQPLLIKVMCLLLVVLPDAYRGAFEAALNSGQDRVVAALQEHNVPVWREELTGSSSILHHPMTLSTMAATPWMKLSKGNCVGMCSRE